MREIDDELGQVCFRNAFSQLFKDMEIERRVGYFSLCLVYHQQILLSYKKGGLMLIYSNFLINSIIYFLLLPEF